MAVPNPNVGGHHHGDDGPDNAPQSHRSGTSSPEIPMDHPAWLVKPVKTPTLTGTMVTLLTSFGYTVIPPAQPSSSRRPRNLAPVADPEERLVSLQGSRLSTLNPTLGVPEHPAEDGPQPDVAPLGEVQASTAGASNGEASKTKSKSKQKNPGKKKKKQEQVQTVCRLFQKSGQCRYGDNCRYSHLLPDTLPPPDGTVDPDPSKKEDDSSEKEGSSKKEEDSPIDLFFAKYPEFDYMRDKPLWDEFVRIGQHSKWQGPKKAQVKNDFRDALVEEFNCVYGKDESSLENWAKLCQAMGLSAPKTLKEAHNIVRGAYVNLVALVQSPRTGESVEVFKSVQDLRQFTAKTKWTFPQEHTQAGGLLNMLLQKMCGQSHGRGYRGKKKTAAK
ncbi:hypothetical protein LCI18_000682 [Fusarium solani-melongenae]|uniref:Uncharacterized protein n=1 Tax=Fusarium solani subsp. cucurbitae TaxID=2747967 RepID=A0ACD3YL79_FUSSC|nr:hypothetical protein LCI18_000682 [Fusarium solani-melongenae]